MIRNATLLALASFGLALHAAVAEPRESPVQFWTNQTTLRPTLAPPPAARPRPRPAPPVPPAGAMARAQAPGAASGPVLAVFGDAFAGSIVRGLADRSLGASGWSVADQTSEDAALTGSDADDAAHVVETWEKKAGHVDAAVVMLGRNDDAPLRDAHGIRVDPGSVPWRTLYADRVERVAAAFRDRRIPLLWVGLPIVRDPDEARLYAAMNEVIRESAVKDGASFLDTWQAFADDNGDFTATGPDVNGRMATLRWTNGWNFTRAGAAKLASFLLPDLKRTRDRLKATEALAVVPNANPDDFDQALSIDVNAQIRREAGLPSDAGASAAKPAGPVLALTAAPVSEHGQLLPMPLIHAGLPAPAAAVTPPGRADNFAWPRQ